MALVVFWEVVLLLPGVGEFAKIYRERLAAF